MGKKVVLTISFIVAAVAFAAAISFQVAKKFADDDEEPTRPTPYPSSDPRHRPVLTGDVRYSAESRSDSASHTSKFAQAQREEDEIGTSESADSQIKANFSGLSLDRLRSSQVSEWKDMSDKFTVEILALEGVQPETGEDGHVTALRADKLLSREGCYSFWFSGTEKELELLR